MRILIVNTYVPFVWGGAEMLAENLNKKLKEFGHQSDIVTIPFKWYPNETLLENTYLNRLLDLKEVSGMKVDMIIPLKFPVYLIPHENKVIWLLHQHRQAYDLWESEFGDISKTPDGVPVREFIKKTDYISFSESKKIYTLSNVVSDRLKKYNGFESYPLYNPPPKENTFYCDDKTKGFFFPSRITQAKRQELVIEALRYTKTDATVTFAGKPDSQEYGNLLTRKVKDYNLEKKVKFLGEISHEEKVKRYAECLGVIFTPIKEDYGYITLEAMLSAKPVITCLDSGGPIEFIDNDKTGIITKSSAIDLAKKIDFLYENKSLAAKMGENSYKKYKALNITWENVVNKLVNES